MPVEGFGEASGVPEGVLEGWLSHKLHTLCQGYKREEIIIWMEQDRF